jgi:hypothetical protein
MTNSTQYFINTDEKNYDTNGYYQINFFVYEAPSGLKYVKNDDRYSGRAKYTTHYKNETSYNNAIKRAQKQFEEFNK